MVATAAARTSTRVAGRHVLAIQDTSMVRSAAEGIGVALHPLIAVDAFDGTLFGLLDARFFIRQGGQRNERRERDLAQKESGRWLEAAHRAAELAGVGAACVTVVSDREGDIYEDFADKPSAVEMLVRAGQDRRLADGSHLLPRPGCCPRPGAWRSICGCSGRRARTAIVSLRFCKVEIARPKHRTSGARAALPRAVALSLVEASEINRRQALMALIGAC